MSKFYIQRITRERMNDDRFQEYVGFILDELQKDTDLAQTKFVATTDESYRKGTSWYFDVAIQATDPRTRSKDAARTLKQLIESRLFEIGRDRKWGDYPWILKDQDGVTITPYVIYPTERFVDLFSHHAPKIIERTLQRQVSKRSNPSALDNMIGWWRQKFSQNNIFSIHVSGEFRAPKFFSESWIYTLDLKFKPESEEFGINEEKFDSHINHLLLDPRWKSNPFIVCDFESGVGVNPDEIEETEAESEDSNPTFDKHFLTWDELEERLPDLESLMNAPDEEIEKIDAFKHLYNMGPQIRIIASVIYRAIETKGCVRDHILLHGLPGAAKSSTLEAFAEYLGEDVTFTMNADTLTAAGTRALFLKRFVKVPPIIIFEEIEKSEANLAQFLGVLDHRGILQKIQHRDQDQRSFKTLFMATCNDKHKLDSMFGGHEITSPNGDKMYYPGALSSRFTQTIEVERPDSETMARILRREIEQFGGDECWIPKALELAEALDNNDPRFVKSLLAGRHRLLDGSYARDQLRVHKSRRELNAVRMRLEHQSEEMDRRDFEYNASMNRNGFKN